MQISASSKGTITPRERIFVRTVNVIGTILCFSGLLMYGCAPSFVQKKTDQKQDFSPAILAEETTEHSANGDSALVYSDEELLLDHILDYYDEALAAHAEENFGRAETNIENAFILAQEIDLEQIGDEYLAERFEEVLAALGMELGKVLNRAIITAEEDPMAWLEEMDVEQFKSGQWADEELKKIVMKIATKTDIPIEFNKNVRNAIYYFQNKGRDNMATWLKRSGRYLPMIQEIFEEEGIPLDMAYLAMIESGYNPRAYSRARAVGMWQFIYSTGKVYGLTRNQWIDERRDPVKSTRAAARHLNDLYKVTDDWNNVMAAYNCGVTRIKRQLKTTKDIEYWDMQLPRETRNYVPTFMAAVIIAKAPEIFGFDMIEKSPPLVYDEVEVHPYTSLKTIGTCAGISIDVLRDLNPELSTNRVPSGKEPYKIKIPENTADAFLVAYAKKPVEKYVPPRVSSYRVRRGDTFSSIAYKHRVSIRHLREANRNIRDINKLRIGQRINIPSGNATGTSTTATAQRSSPANVSVGNTSHYTVRKNDTLGIIAERFHTRVSRLQALNNMGRRTRIYVGQKLLVTAGGDSQPSEETKVASTGSGTITYVVKKNDTLYEIAQKYGVDYRELKRINNIIDHRKIKPGQKLIIIP